MQAVQGAEEWSGHHPNREMEAQHPPGKRLERPPERPFATPDFDEYAHTIMPHAVPGHPSCYIAILIIYLYKLIHVLVYRNISLSRIHGRG